MLIKELKQDTIDSNFSLSSTLRKAKVLAYALKNSPMKDWVENELNGYSGKSTEEIPDYRKTSPQHFGYFSGPFGSGMKNAPIPMSSLPDEIKKEVTTTYFRDSVKSLESMLNMDQKHLETRWPAELIDFIQRHVPMWENMNLVDVRQVVGINFVEGILDTIRNRLLDFILELEENYPEYMASEEELGKIPKDKVSYYFNNYIYGGQNVLASGTHFTQQTGSVVSNDIEALRNHLKLLKIPDGEIKNLEDAVKKDGSITKGKFGKNVSNWIGKITSKILDGTIDMAKNSVTAVVTKITKAIAKYYGIDLE